ncbi:MAG: penicillin-binding protein 2 [Anaerolineae bacterium]
MGAAADRRFPAAVGTLGESGEVMAVNSTTLPQQEILRRRMPFVIVGLMVAAGILMVRLASFQFQLTPDVVSYLETQRDANYRRTLEIAGARGYIYDRNGEPLAVNTLEYQIGVSPNLIAESIRRRTAQQLASTLGLNELEVYDILRSDLPWVMLAPRVSAEIGQRVTALDIYGMDIKPIPRRSYPQGTLAAQVLGFVGADLQGYYGVEGNYQGLLAGAVREREVSNIPFDVNQLDLEADRGQDIVLTIDRDVQFVVEQELQQALIETGAERGSVIVMNPRNGDILAMASNPSYDPNAYFNVTDASQLLNPVISEPWEPGSIFSVLTVASALERGTITPQWSYNDQGVLPVGGIEVRNWDRAAHGVVDVTQILVQSLNIGSAEISTRMGATDFYSMMDQFGIGRLTGVDMYGENSGVMRVPGDPNWSEYYLATNAFGQEVSLTPMQMITAVSAIANGGLMMQPHVVDHIVDGDRVIPSQPSALGRPISAETAQTVTDMMVSVVRDGLDGAASVDGYVVAGKTGTAQVPTPIGYQTGASIVSFVGFLPADDPQLIILVKLDTPDEYWGSRVAAPVFQRIAERLVILLEIPTDDIRHALAAQGGAVEAIPR